MNGKKAKMIRQMAGHVVGEVKVPYMVVPGSQVKKHFVVGMDSLGKEIKQYYNTASFQMEDCSRKMAKQLKTLHGEFNKNKTVSSVRAVTGFKSRKGKVEVVLGNKTLYPKPKRNPMIASMWGVPTHTCVIC